MKSKLLKIAIVFCVFFLSINISLAFDELTTHPAITDEIVDFHNLFSSHKITPEEKELIVSGVVGEDLPPRWINHFYDPIRNIGWTGRNTGFWPTSLVRYLSGTVLSSTYLVSSLNWLHNQELQTYYKIYKGNRTWERAVYEYAHGNPKEALYTLGHVLHLIEDAAVPDHTRDDPHAHDLRLATGDYGSPLEEYAKRYNRNNFNIADKLKDEGYKPVILSQVDDYLVSLAKYSNGYFFSKDTINDPVYQNPRIVREDGEFGYGKDKGGEEFELVNLKKIIDIKNKTINNEYFLPTNDNNAVVISQYFTRLSREAIINGAGVIDLFFKEAEAIILGQKESPKLFTEEPKSVVKRAVTLDIGLGNISATGEFFKIVNLVAGAYNQTKEAVSNIAAGAANLFSFESDGGLSVAFQPLNLINLASSSDSSSSASDISSNVSFEIYQENTNSTVHSQPATLAVGAADKFKQAEELLQDLRNQILALPRQPSSRRSLDGEASPSSGSITVSSLSSSSPSSFSSIETTQPKFVAVISGFGGGGGYSSSAAASPTLPPDITPPASPIVLSPANFSSVFTNPTLYFSGSAEALSVISTDYNNSTTTTNSSGNWSFSLNLGQGTTTINFFATDVAGNLSSSTAVALSVDSLTPAISSFAIAECQNSLSDSGCLVATTTLNIVWNSTAADLSYFVVNNNGTVSTTTATSTVVIASNNIVFSFSVSAVDSAGNYSATSTQTAEISTMPVIINEVAWAGNSASYSDDEWIELYNRTSLPVNLNQFVLYSKTDLSPYVNLSGTMSPKSYRLLERTNDSTISNIAADTIYTGSLVNTGENIVLVYKLSGQATTTIDEILYCFNWCGGSSFSYYSMERYDYNTDGTNASNWGTNNNLIKNGQNATSSAISGTPKARNSVNYLVNRGQNVSANLTLASSSSPYLVNNTIQTFSASSTLTVEPGVTVKFYNNAAWQFMSGANFLVQGTPANPIIFTSFYDDNYGGDLNGDATSTSPSSGDWHGFRVESPGSESIISNAVFRYGGKYYTGAGWVDSKSNLYINNSSATITDSVFEYSKVYGVKLNAASTTFSGSAFRYNNNSEEGDSTGLYSAGGTLTANLNAFSSNRRGAYVSGNNTSNINSNTFSANTSEAINYSGALGVFTNNSGSANGINGIVVSGTLTVANSTTTLGLNSIPYVINSNAATVAASSTLVISSGVVLKSNNKLNVNGNLSINGINAGDVILTSIYDDSVGGDTTNNGSTSPQVGGGGWIDVSTTGNFTGSGFTARYGGSNAYGGNNSAWLSFNGSSGSVSNAVFDNNYPHGIYAINSANLTIASTSLSNHVFNGSWGTKAALSVNTSTTTLSAVSFVNNLLGVFSGGLSSFIASAVTFLNNVATTSPGGLW